MGLLNSFYSGTSNLVSPLKRSDYPPEFSGASRLTFYASQFNSVEVNATFYALPKMATIEKWGLSVPDHFRFTFKVPKGVTHSKDLQFSFEELELFIETVTMVGEKKGCLLVQLPPKVSRDKEEELTGIMECLRENATGWKIAVEFRHPSWYTAGVYRLLQGYGIGMVEHDRPPAATSKINPWLDFVYLRFHGPGERYNGSYDDAILESYAQRIVNLIREGKEVYAYFNNTMGDAYNNLQTLNRLVSTIIK